MLTSILCGLIALCCDTVSSGAKDFAAAMKAQSAPRCVVACGGARHQAMRVGGKTLVVQAGAAVRVVGADDEDADAAEPQRRAWIGVKMSPLPAPLAAHIGDSGLMIINVAKGSPADSAGIERYDVVLSLNGKTVDDMDGLISTINDVGPNKTLQATIIRGGQQKTIAIKTAPWTDQSNAEFKYDEPEDGAVNNSTWLRGHTLHVGPNGQLQLQDLGQLQTLPDALKGLQHLWRIDPNGAGGFQFFGPNGQNDPNGLFNLHLDLDHDGQESQVEVKVQVSEDGETISITRENNGEIQVDRTDASGKHSSATYKDADELKGKDEKAYEVYQKFGAARGQNWISVQPNVDQLPLLQQRYQQQIENSMRRLGRQQGQQSQPGPTIIAPQRKSGDRSSPQQAAPSKSEKKAARSAPEPSGSSTPGLSVTIDDDGAVTVMVRKDGETATYNFKSKSDFKAREPELYKRFEGLAK